MRRKTSPLAALAVIIAVAIVAWWNGKTDSPERPQPRTEVRIDDVRIDEVRIDNVRIDERSQLDATLALIDRGGPFPYRQDGATFGNRERRLPQQPNGYYREYTVPTPGAKNRGARRVVKGRNGETWYTRDHYQTFIRLD